MPCFYILKEVAGALRDFSKEVEITFVKMR